MKDSGLNFCVCCGNCIPEGPQVCDRCGISTEKFKLKKEAFLVGIDTSPGIDISVVHFTPNVKTFPTDEHYVCQECGKKKSIHSSTRGLVCSSCGGHLIGPFDDFMGGFRG